MRLSYVIDNQAHRLLDVLQAPLHRPDLPRERVIQTLRFLGTPLRRATLKELRRAYTAYQTDVAAAAPIGIPTSFEIGSYAGAEPRPFLEG